MSGELWYSDETQERLSALLDMLSAEEWLGIARADDDGLWGPCCGNVDHVRALLVRVGVSRLPLAEDWRALCAALLDEVDDHLVPDSVLHRFAVAVEAVLAEADPGWREELEGDTAKSRDLTLNARVLALALGGITAFGDEQGWVSAYYPELLDVLVDPVKAAQVVADYHSRLADVEAFRAGEAQ